MVRIAITQVAFDAIARTLPLGSVGYENQTNERGERRPQHPAVRRSAGRLRDDGANLRALLKRRRRRRSAQMRQRPRPDDCSACAVARLSRTETQVKQTEHRGQHHNLHDP